MVVDFQESTSAIIPPFCTLPTLTHIQPPPTSNTSFFSISYFSACVCLWHHKAGSVGMQRLLEPVMYVWGISTQWDTEKERELLHF